MSWKSTIAPLAFAVAAPAAGCSSYGAARLNSDQVDYGRAIRASKKRQTLFNIASLRCSDVPSLPSVTQIIAGYSRVASVNGSGLRRRRPPIALRSSAAV